MSLVKKYIYEFTRDGYSVRVFVDAMDQLSFHRFIYPKECTEKERAAFIEAASDSVMLAMEASYITTGS